MGRITYVRNPLKVKFKQLIKDVAIKVSGTVGLNSDDIKAIG